MNRHHQSNNQNSPSNLTPLSLPRFARVSGHTINGIFKRGQSQDFKALGEMIYRPEAVRLLPYIGKRLAEDLRPVSAEAACDLMKLQSYKGIDGFLTSLAHRNAQGARRSNGRLLEGDEFRELRQLIANVAVWPKHSFCEADYVQRRMPIEGLTRLPIALLRRCAGPEVDAILVDGVKNSICPAVNGRALELLLVRERSSSERVLLPAQVVTIASILRSDLHDEISRSLAVAIVDRWLQKLAHGPLDGEAELRAILLAEWAEFNRFPPLLVPGEPVKIMHTLVLLRHFIDQEARDVMRSACNHSHWGISSLGALIYSDGARGAVSLLSRRTSPDTPRDKRIEALGAFAHRISRDVDLLLWPRFERYINVDFYKCQKAAGGDMNDDSSKEMQVALECVFRRFFSEPLSGAFIGRLFGKLKDTKRPMWLFAVGVLDFVEQFDRVPPIEFYDSPEILASVDRLIRLREKCGAGTERNDSIVAGAVRIREHFFEYGPQSYGYEETTQSP